jgi:hypothetical protein
VSRYLVRVTRDKVVEVESIAAASKAVRHTIEAELGWMGAAQWHRTVARSNHGVMLWELVVVDGKQAQRPLGTISYNGRCWDLRGEEIAL